jgi:hypothetical protein
MKQYILFCACICSSFILSDEVFAKSKLLESVDLDDKNMSTEGGTADLYLIDLHNGRNCRIEVVHYGENGKTTLVFIFGDKLKYAIMKRYKYEVPISMSSDAKIYSTEVTTLRSQGGYKSLRKEFRLYRSFFRFESLANCATQHRKSR